MDGLPVAATVEDMQRGRGKREERGGAGRRRGEGQVGGEGRGKREVRGDAYIRCIHKTRSLLVTLKLHQLGHFSHCNTILCTKLLSCHYVTKSKYNYY